MKIEILSTSQDRFIWWAVSDDGQMTQKETALDIKDLKTQLSRYIETQFETKRILE